MHKHTQTQTHKTQKLTDINTHTQTLRQDVDGIDAGGNDDDDDDECFQQEVPVKPL